MLILRKINQNDEEAFLHALCEWDEDPRFIFASGYNKGMNFSTYLNHLKDKEQGLNLPANYVADTTFFGFLGKKIVGRLSIRHTLTEHLLKVGGHIGYGVVPSERRQGYATKMLRFSLAEAKKLGLKKVLVTCDDNNHGSIKVIESSGGQLENIVMVEIGKPYKLRYWIEL